MPIAVITCNLTSALGAGSQRRRRCRTATRMAIERRRCSTYADPCDRGLGCLGTRNVECLGRTRIPRGGQSHRRAGRPVRLRDVLAQHDCDDMFALIAELSSSGETWKIQFQADLAPDRVLSHTLNRHRSIVAHEQQVVPHSGDEAGSKGPELPVQDLDTSQGKNDFRRAMRGVTDRRFRGDWCRS